MANEFSAERLFEWWIGKFIWFYLPFRAIRILGKDLLREVFSREK